MRENSHKGSQSRLDCDIPLPTMGSRPKSTAGEEKTKLSKRLNRIRGQVEALRRALEEDASCAAVLQQATACRGALDGFIAEVIEDHIRQHVVDAKDRASAAEASEELIRIVHSYLT